MYYLLISFLGGINHFTPSHGHGHIIFSLVLTHIHVGSHAHVYASVFILFNCLQMP